MKNPILLCIGVLAATCSIAQIAGPENGSAFTIAPLSGSTQFWINAENTELSDNVYASFGNLAGGTGSHTDYLVATKFGFNIPAGATVTGIMVEVERSDPNSRTSDYSIRIVKDDTIGVAEHSGGASYPIGDSYQTYGSAGDLWGQTWLADDINAPGFGVAIAAQRSVAGGVTAGRVDNLRITVFYNFMILSVKITSFSLKKTEKTVQLNWNTAEESNMHHYEIQRSVNGIDFSSLGTVASRNLAGSGHYSFDDHDPLQGISYYRLKTISNSGSINYSKIISVQFSTGNSISLYPNPWQKGTDLFITNPNHELLTIQFFTASGQLRATVTTSSGKIPANALDAINGMSWYRIYNSDHSQRSSGILLNPQSQ